VRPSLLPFNSGLRGHGGGWLRVRDGLAIGADESVGIDDGGGGVELPVVGGIEVDPAVEAGNEKEPDFAFAAGLDG